MAALKARALRIMSTLRNRMAGAAAPRISHDRDSWERVAQDGEFAFHAKDTWRPSADFMDQSIRLFDHFGFSRDGWEDKVVVDLGAGS